MTTTNTLKEQFIVCSICHQTESEKDMVEVSSHIRWVPNSKICYSCIKNIVTISTKGGVNEPTSYRNWTDNAVTADEYNEVVQKWYNTHENGQDEFILMVMQWISTNSKSNLLPFLWEHSEKPEHKNDKGKKNNKKKKKKNKQKYLPVKKKKIK